MSRDGSIAIEFGGEERQFRLGIGQLRALQEKCDAGPFEIVQRMAPYLAYSAEVDAAAATGAPRPSPVLAMVQGRFGMARIDDIRETIYQGLIGGGMTPNEAGRIRAQYVDSRPLLESLVPAATILIAAIMGAPDEPAAGER